MNFSRRNLLLASPFLVLWRPEISKASTRKKLAELKEEFLEEGIGDANFTNVIKERKIDVGATIPRSQSFPFQGKAEHILRSNFSLFVPEVELNWEDDDNPRAIGDYNQERLNKIFELAKSANAKVKGHALYYYRCFPQRVRDIALSAASNAEVEKVITEIVQERVSFYKGRISHWVINELIDWDGSFRAEPLMDRFGPKIISIVSKAALSIDPNIKLEILDNNIGYRGSEQALKATLKLVDSLRVDGVEISNIGVQGHFYSESNQDTDADTSLAPYKAIAQAGMTFSIAELDVNDREFKGPVEERDMRIAEIYFEYLSAVTKMGNLSEVTSWSPFDTMNWIKNGDGSDGTIVKESRTGWFDEAFEPKFLYFVTAKALLSPS
jgi:GH35 family endo-1,4-beta-xylanase